MALITPAAVPAPARRPATWPGWNNLPRDARDTLFLLGVIGWTVLPHVSHLPLWCALLTAAVLLWRARLAIANAPLPGRWVLVAVLFIALGLTFYSFRTLLGKEAGVTLIVVLMALKTLELRARRDAFVVFFLGFFLILTHFLYSQSLPVALAMLVSIWGLLTALVLAHMPVGQPSLKTASFLSARTALFGAPIMALLFVLFPRIGPLWGVPQDGQASTGLSSSMRMGSVAEIAADDSVAMRLRFKGTPPPSATLYFRGPVLSRFDGAEWLPANAYSRPAEVEVSGDPVPYEVTLEPSRLTYLPLLEATPVAPRIDNVRVYALPGMQWLTTRPIVERLRFDAVGYTRFKQSASAPLVELRADVELPASFNPRTLAWAEKMRAQGGFSSDRPRPIAAALMQHIRTGGYSYTLAPGNYGRDAIDEFWLDRKAGFCEHFAAAFVVVMRAMDVPARVVTGYQGTDPQPLDGYYLVRQSSAHAWAEYWDPAGGWVRADPTAAVAPERIDRSRRLLPAPGLVAGAIDQMSPALLARLRDNWELLNNRWNQWVLSYSRGQQIDLLKNLGFESPSWEDLALLLIGSFSTFALAGAAWAWWDRHRIDPWVRQMERLRRALLAAGVDAAPHEAPRTLAERLRARFGAGGENAAALLDALDRQRYSRTTAARPDGRLTREFVSLARQLKAGVG